MTDFSAVPTHKLASDTFLRSKDVHQINEAAWGAYLQLLSLVCCGVLAALVAFHFGGRVLAILAAFPFCVTGIVNWGVALGDCAAYTAEMNERRIELERRRK